MTGTLPRYVSFANELRKEILSGKYGFEGGLPGIKELGRRSKLAYNTIYRSLTLLVGEKLLIERDSAFFVNTSTITMTQYVPPPRISMPQRGKTPFIRNIAPVERTSLPDFIADSVGLEHGTMSTFRYRIAGEIQDDKEVPSSLATYHYIISLSDEQIQDLQDDPHADILAELYPVPMMRYDLVASRHPTHEEAQLLSVTENTPILDLRIVNRDLNRNILLIQQLVLLGTSLNYSYTFENRLPK